MRIIDIDSAACFKEIEKIKNDAGETVYQLPGMNDKYKYAAIDDDKEIVYCIDENGNGGLAIAVMMNGVIVTPSHLLMNKNEVSE